MSLPPADHQYIRCGCAALTGPYGTLLSPGYPSYITKINCTWHVEVEPHQVRGLPKTSRPGPRLIINTVFPGVGISIIKIRGSWHRLVFIMGIPILVRLHLYIKTGLRLSGPIFSEKAQAVYGQSQSRLRQWSGLWLAEHSLSLLRERDRKRTQDPNYSPPMLVQSKNYAFITYKKNPKWAIMFI